MKWTDYFPYGKFSVWAAIRLGWFSLFHANRQYFYDIDDRYTATSKNDYPTYGEIRGIVWTKNGEKHREGLPAIVGRKFRGWYLNGEPHRIDGPAIDWENGMKIYYQYGKPHRLDGPAHIQKYPDHKEWWVNGKLITYDIEPWAEEMDIDLDNLTEDDKIMIKLKFGNGCD